MQEALQILKKIESYGYQAYLVGGAPRNAYLGLTVLDFDICTSATPQELKTIFPELDMRYQKYGNVRLEENGNLYEITTFRKDFCYYDHRKPEQVTFVKTLQEDLERRDFIINTLCINSKGEYVDYFHARDDLDARLIRSVGDAERKLAEDALRILRAIRFACTLNFVIDPILSKAIHHQRQHLKSISYQRKKEELEKILITETGISYLLFYELEEVLELPNLKNVNSRELSKIWKELDVFTIYPFSKKEKEIIFKECEK